MANSVPVKKFIKYLKMCGLVCVRITDSHEIYDFLEPSKKLLRPVTVDRNYKDVPMLHIHTNLKTLGISKKKFLEEIKKI